MRNINKVILVGNISRDPVGKEVAGGQMIATFGVATHRQFTTKNSEQKSVTEFHNVAAWGPLAKRCVETLKKGKLVYIEGYLKTRSFDLDNGQRTFRTEIVAQNMIILSKREDGDNLPEADSFPTAETDAPDLGNLDDLFDPSDSSTTTAEVSQETKGEEAKE